MRIYLNSVEAITDIGRELKKCATEVHTQTYQNKDISHDPNFKTKEIQAFEFMVINMDDKDQMPNVTLEWAKAEFGERISTSVANPGKAWELRKEVWEQFLVEQYYEDENNVQHSKKVFEYTYSERIASQIRPVISELRFRPQTRQAIISVYNSYIDLRSMGSRRVPCSMYYQFMIRDNKLDIIYVMRSSDFATHFQNDMWLADELRRYIASMLGIESGKFIMMIDSLHIYQKDWEQLKRY